MGQLPDNTVVFSGLYLSIKNIRKHNEGYYECQGSYDSVTKFKSRAYMQVKG